MVQVAKTLRSAYKGKEEKLENPSCSFRRLPLPPFQEQKDNLCASMNNINFSLHASLVLVLSVSFSGDHPEEARPKLCAVVFLLQTFTSLRE